MHLRCFADDQNKKLILGRNILTEIFLAQFLEGAVSAQLVDGAVEGVEEGRVFALDDRDRNVRSIFGLGYQLEVGVRMDVQVVVEGDVGVQGGIDAARPANRLSQSLSTYSGSTPSFSAMARETSTS